MKRWNRNEKKLHKAVEFTLAEGATHVENFNDCRKTAFTLAEVLITMAVIGVVAAVTVPALVINIQERVQNEQARSAKYKLTKATDKMKSLGLLDSRYSTANSTQDFVRELQKHLKLMKVCDNSHLTDCWPTETINLPSAVTGYETDVSKLTTGDKLKAIAPETKATTTMGIVTADGTPMILLYSPACSALDVARTYSWSTIDNKPETNATTNCITALIDTNGKKGPNMLGKDVRTLNSMYGSLGPVDSGTFGTLSSSNCNGLKKKLGINSCSTGTDYWGGAMKYCYDRGLHLPSEQTLANLAGARYGRSDISPLTIIASDYWTKNTWGKNQKEMAEAGNSCIEIWRATDSVYTTADQIICITENGNQNSMVLDKTATAGYYIPDGHYWSSVEVSSSQARSRYIRSTTSGFYTYDRSTSDYKALCVGD